MARIQLIFSAAFVLIFYFTNFAIAQNKGFGSYQEIKQGTPEYNELVDDAAKINLKSVPGADGLDAGAKIVQVKQASQQVVAGTNYLFSAIVQNGKQTEDVCFKAFKGLEKGAKLNVDFVKRKCDFNTFKLDYM